MIINIKCVYNVETLKLEINISKNFWMLFEFWLPTLSMRLISWKVFERNFWFTGPVVSAWALIGTLALVAEMDIWYQIIQSPSDIDGLFSPTLVLGASGLKLCILSPDLDWWVVGVCPPGRHRVSCCPQDGGDWAVWCWPGSGDGLLQWRGPGAVQGWSTAVSRQLSSHQHQQC